MHSPLLCFHIAKFLKPASIIKLLRASLHAPLPFDFHQIGSYVWTIPGKLSSNILKMHSQYTMTVQRYCQGAEDNLVVWILRGVSDQYFNYSDVSQLLSD